MVLRRIRRKRLRNDAELEEAAGIARTVPRSYTAQEIARMERKMLGPSWGKKRRKFTGPR